MKKQELAYRLKIKNIIVLIHPTIENDEVHVLYIILYTKIYHRPIFSNTYAIIYILMNGKVS